eukprot:3428634-Rhodomonas_salina.1
MLFPTASTSRAQSALRARAPARKPMTTGEDREGAQRRSASTATTAWQHSPWQHSPCKPAPTPRGYIPESTNEENHTKESRMFLDSTSQCSKRVGGRESVPSHAGVHSSGAVVDGGPEGRHWPHHPAPTQYHAAPSQYHTAPRQYRAAPRQYRAAPRPYAPPYRTVSTVQHRGSTRSALPRTKAC